MSTEWGALAGVFPGDEVTINWFRDQAAKATANTITPTTRAKLADTTRNGTVAERFGPEAMDQLELSYSHGDLTADEGAVYNKSFTLDLSTVSPHVSGPNHVKTMQPVSGAGHIKITKAYLVSCVNSRFEDIQAAAEVIRGQKIHPDVEMYIAAASSRVQAESEASGDWESLLDAGCKPLPSGCGPCVGLGAGLLEAGDVCISATNRNFRGRMGHRDAVAYLGSPAVVAASALAGRIATPQGWQATDGKEPTPQGSVEVHGGSSSSGSRSSSSSIVAGFPESQRSEAVFCPQDNLDTDGIYAGTHTYREDFGPAEVNPTHLSAF